MDCHSIKTSEQILTWQKRDDGCKPKGVDGSAAEGSGRWSNLRIEPFLKNTLDALKDNCYIEWLRLFLEHLLEKGKNQEKQ